MWGASPRSSTGGRLGVLVPPADPVALADGISRLLGDRALMERLSSEGCAFARERFSAERMVDAHIQLYEGLLAARGARGARGGRGVEES